MSTARTNKRILMKKMTTEEINEMKKAEAQAKRKGIEESKRIKAAKKAADNAAYKNLSLEERRKILLVRKLKKAEFPYLAEIIKVPKKLEEMRVKMAEGKIVYGDPGGRSPITLFGKDAKRKKNEKRIGRINGVFNYRNRRRASETKRGKYTRMRNNKTKKIFGSESTKVKYGALSKTLTKTNDVGKFSEYLKLKYEILKLLTAEQLERLSGET